MLYQFQDGVIVESRNNESLIDQMMGNWPEKDNRQDYMEAVSDRLRKVSGLILRTDSKEKFIRDAISLGIITPISD